MKTKTLAGGAGLVLLMLAASTLSAAPITGLTNTGVNLVGQADQSWTVTGTAGCPAGATLCGGGVAYSPTDQAGASPVGFAGDFWNVVNSGTSTWITPGVRSNGTMEETSPGANNHLDFGSGSFWAYETTFTLPAFVSATITGSWWADGTLNFATGGSDGLGGSNCGIFLNGSCVGVPNNLVGAPSSFEGPNGHLDAAGNAFSIASGFQQGTNTLRFVVRNAGQETGLRVSMTGDFQTEAIPEPATYALMGAGLAMVAILRRRRA